MTEKYDAIVIGGGHNSLVAACYLAKENKKVLLLERNPTLGGATASVYAFDGVAAKLSRYSYLVALLPDQIRSDLELNFETISRTVSSYTPARDSGILVKRVFDDISRNSISNFTKNETDSVSWEKFYDRIAVFAKKVAPTMLEPLPTTSQIRSLVGEDLWQEFVETPLCKTLDKYFVDDVIKGIVLTDGLIGTFASACDKAANICFLYHLIGNGTGEWKVPKPPGTEPRTRRSRPRIHPKPCLRTHISKCVGAKRSSEATRPSKHVCLHVRTQGAYSRRLGVQIQMFPDDLPSLLYGRGGSCELEVIDVHGQH